jgi:hypothetical protein
MVAGGFYFGGRLGRAKPTMAAKTTYDSVARTLEEATLVFGDQL